MSRRSAIGSVLAALVAACGDSTGPRAWPLQPIAPGPMLLIAARSIPDTDAANSWFVQVLVSNVGLVPDTLRFGSCSFVPAIFRTADRHMPPAWDDRPSDLAGCDKVLQHLLPVPPQATAGQIVSRIPAGLSLPARRYYVALVYQVGDQVIVAPADSIQLPGR